MEWGKVDNIRIWDRDGEDPGAGRCDSDPDRIPDPDADATPILGPPALALALALIPACASDWEGCAEDELALKPVGADSDAEGLTVFPAVAAAAADLHRATSVSHQCVISVLVLIRLTDGEESISRVRERRRS